MRTTKFGRLALMAAVAMTLTYLPISSYADTSASPQIATGQTLSMVGQPQMIFNSTIPCMQVTFMNQSPSPINGTVYAVLRNGLGETMEIAASPLPLVAPGSTASATIFLTAPFDSYTTYVFAVNSFGVSVSPTTNSTMVA